MKVRKTRELVDKKRLKPSRSMPTYTPMWNHRGVVNQCGLYPDCSDTGLIAPIIFSLRLPVLASAVLVLAAPLIYQQLLVEREAFIAISDIFGSTKVEKRIKGINNRLVANIDISRLPKGTYFVTVITGKNIAKTTIFKE